METLQIKEARHRRSQIPFYEMSGTGKFTETENSVVVVGGQRHG